MKPRVLSLLILAFSSIFIQAQTLIIHHNDGTMTNVALYLKPRVVFDGELVRITSAVLDMEYPKENVLKFSYEGMANDIQIPFADAEHSSEAGQLVFHGIEGTDKVAVYNDKGIRLHLNLVRQGNDICLPLADIPSGVYVLSVNGKSSKFLKP